MSLLLRLCAALCLLLSLASAFTAVRYVRVGPSSPLTRTNALSFEGRSAVDTVKQVLKESRQMIPAKRLAPVGEVDVEAAKEARTKALLAAYLKIKTK
ncbi:unnamed protein product [Vitrella brassicaformis CCMP3155]|uniref:RxLR effector protein n=2 Tax=Vitrella brassicaformis TaxID=1169539 RepID=A0A0G4EHE4_VITBC|nr:unnamed protein product [Vitrella brassicaformis CCMP3155]|eukprot:CEL95916.1 unnamed protein product [Vitrella brassicaformis CCMP3155]